MAYSKNDHIEIELERGLTFYFEQQAEFDRRGYPVEKQVAIAFEAGRQIGACEVKCKVAKCFQPDPGLEWP